jgi:hypothetical protein
MKPCKACQDLIGKASTTPPHGDLAAAGVSFFGATTNPTQISTNWQCTVCGTWLYQCTSAGDPPNKWRAGESPADWPWITLESQFMASTKWVPLHMAPRRNSTTTPTN